MDISNAKCAGCGRRMKIKRIECDHCGVSSEGEFEVPALGRLSTEDQLFVLAFLRHHGSIKKMEKTFGISYPTVKNRLRALNSELEKSFEAPSPNSLLLEALARGEITVDEALERMS